MIKVEYSALPAYCHFLQPKFIRSLRFRVCQLLNILCLADKVLDPFQFTIQHLKLKTPQVPVSRKEAKIAMM